MRSFVLTLLVLLVSVWSRKKNNKIMSQINTGICSQSILFWITHPTRQLGALSKRDNKKILISPINKLDWRGDYLSCQIMARLDGVQAPISKCFCGQVVPAPGLKIKSLPIIVFHYVYRHSLSSQYFLIRRDSTFFQVKTLLVLLVIYVLGQQ